MITPSLNWSDVVICPSVSERNRIKKFFHKSSDRIFAIPHGVKLEFPSQPKSFVNEKHLPENFILYVGRLNDRKNVANLLSAVKDKLDLKLVIVGKRDWLETSLPEKIESENVTWFKWLTESELTFLYMKASVFCFPSKAEGFGLPVLEAMYFGLPVICGHNTSLAEVGADCVHYVDIDSPEAIYQGIVKVLNDVEYRNHLSQKGLARSREFTWDRTVNEMLRVIQCL
jgi:glycosyltransferase involved in cell wall biosynthesis